MKFSIIIPAAGSGRRFGGYKVLEEVFGYPLIFYTLLPFELWEHTGEIILLLPEAKLNEGSELQKYFKKLKLIIPGGEERADSVYIGLKRASFQYVMVHDGARPFITKKILENIYKKFEKGTHAVAPVIPLRDTVKFKGDIDIHGLLEREKYVAVQTPQAFKRELLISAFELAREKGKKFTDETSLVEWALGLNSHMIDGDPRNVKITYREDLDIFKGLVAKEIRVGLGYDIHKLAEGRKLVIGGVEIPFEKGALGHSDGDVLLHAIIDAMFGAASVRDIGSHFPDTDERFREIASTVLLEEAFKIINKQGYWILNIDATVKLERPKILPYVSKMKERISSILKIKEDRISIKGKRGEGVGPVGEGIAVEAMVTLLLLRHPAFS